jgi:hypothetical protein
LEVGIGASKSGGGSSSWLKVTTEKGERNTGEGKGGRKTGEGKEKGERNEEVGVGASKSGGYGSSRLGEGEKGRKENGRGEREER